MLTTYLIFAPVALVAIWWLHRYRPALRVDDLLNVEWLETRLPVWEAWDARECASLGLSALGPARPFPNPEIIAKREALSAQMDRDRAARAATPLAHKTPWKDRRTPQ